MKNIPVKRPSKKLADKFSGPYVIEEPIGKQAYRLNLPTAWRQHNVFHISLLKPYRPRDGEKDAMIMTAPEIVNDVKEYAVEQILSKRKTKGVTRYLVKWKNWGDEYNQWEPEENLANAQEKIEEFENRPKPRRGRPRR